MKFQSEVSNDPFLLKSSQLLQQTLRLLSGAGSGGWKWVLWLADGERRFIVLRGNEHAEAAVWEVVPEHFAIH